MTRALPTIGDLLQEAGYETVYHGKWHLGGRIGEYGFEHAEECSLDEETRRMASRFWRDHDWVSYKRPFFHVVSLLDPHDLYFYDPEKPDSASRRRWANTKSHEGAYPAAVQAKQADLDEDTWSAIIRFYEERIEKVDADLGRLLEELRCSGFYNDTWIIFCSDHGDMCGEHNLPFKGSFMYEGVVRVPLVVVPPQSRFTGKHPASLFSEDIPLGRRDTLCSLIDVPATILELAGVEKPAEWEGASLLPWVRGKAEGDPHETVFAIWHQPRIHMARSRTWKYIRFDNGEEELFHLAEDPHETRNRSADPECATVLAEYRSRLDGHIQKTRPRNA